MENFSKPKTEILNIKPMLMQDFGVPASVKMTHTREVRLAITIEDSEADPTYPEPDDKPNTYPLAFVDGEFNETAGYQLPTITNNAIDNKPEIRAFYVGEKYIPVGTIVLVYLVPGLDTTTSGEWWIDSGGIGILLGKADVTIANEAEGLVSWWNGTQGEEEDTGINFTCWNKFASVPEGAWVPFFQNEDGYYLLPRGSTTTVTGSNITRFRLTQNLTLGSSAMAVILTPDGGGGYTVGDAIYVYDWFNTGSPGMFSGRVGYEGFAVIRAAGDYDIVWMETPAKWLTFVLDEDISETAPAVWSASATVSYYSHGRLLNATQTVYAANETFRRCAEFAGGIAIYNDQLARYEIIRCEQLAVNATAVLTSAMCDAENEFFDGEWPIEDFNGFGAGENILFPADPLYVSNPYNHKGKAGDKVGLEYGHPGYADKWVIVWVALHEIDVITSVGQTGCSLTRAKVTVSVELCTDPGTADEYGETGVPFSFIHYKTTCIGGVITTQYQVVDIDPCADPQDTYGDWMTFSAGGCCECEPVDCEAAGEGDEFSASISSSCPTLDGVTLTLTGGVGGTWSSPLGAPCMGILTLQCSAGEWVSTFGTSGGIGAVLSGPVVVSGDPVTGSGVANHNGGTISNTDLPTCCPEIEGIGTVSTLVVTYTLVP